MLLSSLRFKRWLFETGFTFKPPHSCISVSCIRYDLSAAEQLECISSQVTRLQRRCHLCLLVYPQQNFARHYELEIYSGREYWSSYQYWSPYEKRTIGILVDNCNSFLNGRKTKVYINRINKNSFMQELRHQLPVQHNKNSTTTKNLLFYALRFFNCRVTSIVKVVLSSILVPTFYRYLQVLRDSLRTLLTLTL